NELNVNTIAPKIPFSSEIHDPIYISGNIELANFIANEGLDGDGTNEFPYIIEGYTINASTAHGICIYYTNSYLIIRDCIISGGNSSYYGIYLLNVQNANISNNEFTWNKYGIYISHSSYNAFSSNIINYNEKNGISLHFSEYNTFSENIINYNENIGMMLFSSNNITLLGNIANYNRYQDFTLVISNSNTFSGNIMNNGIMIFSGSDNNSIDTSNKVNSKSIRYYENTQGVHLSWESDVGQVILVKCNDSIIEGLEISDVSYGIIVVNSYNCLISDNTLNNCINGIYLYYSYDTTLSRNEMNHTGIFIVYSYDNNIDTTNKVNGKSVRYYENIQGVHLSRESDVGQVILINCSDSIIEGLSIVDTSIGIFLQDSVHCSLTDNTISGCFTGIELFFR
ncbi:MAG: NosD domain-containing protein, partial [Promethearchaeota archaeon]